MKRPSPAGTGRRATAIALLVNTLSLGACLEDTLSPIRSVSSDAAFGDSAAEDVSVANDSQPPGSCASSADCPTDSACELGLAGCTAQRCGLPTAEQGTLSQGRPCPNPGSCEAGLVCAPLLLTLRDGMLQPAISGQCLPACDPCAPSCSPPATCIQLPTGGGYCAHGGLANEGEPCEGRGCRGRTTCDLAATKVCRRACNPANPTLPGDRGAAPSDDCLTTEVCFHSGVSSIDGDMFVCEVGEFVEVGSYCNMEIGLYCPAPVVCSARIRICELSPCPSLGCPPDTRCSLLWDDVAVVELCVRDGALPFGARCGDDENCSGTLVCQPGQPPDERKSCVQP